MNSKEKHTHHHDIDSALKSRLILSIALTAVIFVTELVGGYLTNSLALISDAAHVFMDVFALSLSLFAIYISEMPPSDQTRACTGGGIVSFINSLVLFLLTLFIFT
jgi:cobalt-zinc-cadmium efflux system protein